MSRGAEEIDISSLSLFIPGFRFSSRTTSCWGRKRSLRLGSFNFSSFCLLACALCLQSGKLTPDELAGLDEVERDECTKDKVLRSGVCHLEDETVSQELGESCCWRQKLKLGCALVLVGCEPCHLECRCCDTVD